MIGTVVIIILAVIFLIIFFSFVPLGLWISARASGVKIGIFQLVGMRVRKVVPSRIVNPMIKTTKAGLDISINKLCSMSGVTQSTINNIVCGRNNSATISTIKKLCDGLGITIQDFFNASLFMDLDQEVE